MVSIATWNVENLFAPDADAGPDTAAEYAAKADVLAATISAMAPDVLALQEIGDPGALEDVLGRVGGRWYVETADPDGRGIRVAIAARTPLSEAYQVGPFLEGLRPVQVDDTGVGETAMGRPALHAVVEGMHVLTCHLKSKLLTFPGGRFSPCDENERARFATYALFRRAAEVRAAATTILDQDGATRLVVLGDLNDTVDAATTQLVAGPPGSEIGTGYAHPDSGDRQRLWNLAARIPDDQRFSRIYRGRRELIDHILVSMGWLIRSLTAR
jgi:predicted extracellular nuclease